MFADDLLFLGGQCSSLHQQGAGHFHLADVHQQDPEGKVLQFSLFQARVATKGGGEGRATDRVGVGIVVTFFRRVSHRLASALRRMLSTMWMLALRTPSTFSGLHGWRGHCTVQTPWPALAVTNSRSSLTTVLTAMPPPPRRKTLRTKSIKPSRRRSMPPAMKRLPIQKLKIDQNFIQDLGNKHGGVALVQAILAMGKALDMQVTAEGVETEKQLAMLKIMRCDSAQGYHLGQPAADFGAQLNVNA